MKNLLITFLTCLLANNTLVYANDATTNVEEPILLSGPNEGSDGEDACNFISAVQIGYCLAEKANSTESELNRIYKEIMDSLDKDRQNTLRKEERSWIKWREAECARQAKDVADCVNGCGVPRTMHIVCMTKEAKSRVQHLKSQWQR